MSDRPQKSVRHTATTEILLALIPYTRQNLLLSFHPGQFFDELARTSSYSRKNLQSSYIKAKHRGLIVDRDNTIELSLPARQAVQPFVAHTLPGGGKLMVIFDIPEDYSHLRRKLRQVLRHLGFTQVQQSVWMSSQDHVAIMRETIEDLHIGDWVQLYEAAPVR